MRAPDSIDCPKCGGRAAGPRYRTPRFPLYEESLAYLCRCGYEQFLPTYDAKPKAVAEVPTR
jgi:hypothetical protein